MAEYIERTEELMLAMNAGARAIENTKRYHGAVYTKDVFSENPQKIPYVLAAKVLREVSDAPAADVAPMVRTLWAHLGGDEWCCPVCGFVITTEGSWDKPTKKYCEDCGAKMDGGDNDEADRVIRAMPTVDAEVVVRCKGCKHYDMGVCLKIYSDSNVQSAAWQKRKPEDFCSYGERNQNQ